MEDYELSEDEVVKAWNLWKADFKENELTRDERMPLPETPELLAHAQADEKSMLQYCKKAKKRRAFPD